MIRNLVDWGRGVVARHHAPVASPSRTRARPVPIREGGRNREADRALLVAALIEAYGRSKSRIDDADRTAMVEVTDEQGRTMTRVLTLGEVADALVAAGWRPPRERS